jgi:hypothetical protein
MPKIFTTSDAETKAKRQMRYILIAGGLRSKDPNEYLPHNFQYSRYLDSAKKVCDELVNRDFSNIDDALHTLHSYAPVARKETRFKAEGFAKAIVYLAELLELYWDDTLKTPYEVEEFKKTLLGDAVYKYGRYISAIQDKPARASRSASTASSTSTSSTGTSSSGNNSTSQPQNGYKSSGAQSGNVRDLQDPDGGPGTPSQKVFADGKYIFRIIGDNPQSKNIPNVFIKPLSASGATGNTNKVFFSSGNGYTDCTCYFDDENDAQNFLNKIIAAGRVPANISNPRVVKRTADSNGYFLAGTEFGVCAISAKTLNETLTEAADDSTGGWEKATEECSKEELKELHTWMRRD